MFVVKCGGKVLALMWSKQWLASDACVDTLARPTGVGRLAGRPVPLGRRSLRTAFAAGGTSRSGFLVEAFPDGLA